MSDRLTTLQAVADGRLRLAARADEGPGREALLNLADRTLAEAVLIDADCAPTQAAAGSMPLGSHGVRAASEKD